MLPQATNALLMTQTQNDRLASIKKNLYKRSAAKNKPIRDASDCLLAFITQNPPEDNEDLSFGAIRNILQFHCKLKLSDEDYLDVINHFVSPFIGLLDMVFTFVDPYTGEIYPIDKKTMKQAIIAGEFYHPEITDETVDNFQQHIIITYTITDLGKKLYHTLNNREQQNI